MQKFPFLPTLPSLLSAPETPLIHRDLSWLQFNERVLAEARAPTNPLLERVKFLAISSSNLDEFFAIRLASLLKSITRARVTSTQDDDSAYLHLSRTAASVFEIIAKFGAKQVEAFELITSELENLGVSIVRQARADSPVFELGRQLFNETVLPQLLPPEPFSAAQLGTLQNLQLAALFTGPTTGPAGGQFFRIPKSLPPMLHRDNHFFFLDDLLASHLGTAFGIAGNPAIVRVTRDGDFSVDLEDEDSASIPDVIRSSLSTRDKGRVVRLQYLGPLSEQVLLKCLSQLKLTTPQIYPAPASLLLHGLWSVFQNIPDELAERHQLRHPPLKALIPRGLTRKERLFDELRQQDFLLHHPYDSFDSFVSFIETACDDPTVASIEQTIYRMDAVSPILSALKRAAGSGKKVRAFIELRARFDELNNLRLADELRQSGVEVHFGFGKLKLHAKVALITRNESDGVRYYTHLSTGNYNAATARQYTDLAILTSSQQIGQDARYFFDAIIRGEVPQKFTTLVSAPTRLHRRLLAQIQAETEAARAGKSARIFAKVNALVDAAVIENLYLASQAGVKIDLVVRGACSLVPGVAGLSENIRVISIVDRFLEHSRIYYFSSSEALYLSSADWMPRNFFSRLEIAFPVQDALLRKYLIEFLIPTYLNDNVKARELTPQGTWKKRPTRAGKALRSQFVFEEAAANRYLGTPLE